MLKDIAAFVDLRPHSCSETEIRHGAGVYEAPINQEVRTYLVKFYKPHIERLYELLNRNFGWFRALADLLRPTWRCRDDRNACP